MHLKRIKLEHAFNIRDMGGYCAENNKTVKWNMLYRSDGLNTLSKSEWDFLYFEGIRTIVDLRSSAEIKATPDNTPAGFSYIHCPVQAEDHKNDTAENAFVRSLIAGYRDIAENNPDLVANALLGITNALKNGAVIFHCSAGKDRTGVIAALIYLILGVDRFDIIADYEVSGTYNDAGINHTMASHPAFTGLPHLKLSKAEYMADFLDFCKSSNIFEKLAEFGFSAETAEMLRSLILE